MAEANSWSPGDLVQVKSGGPVMTVAGQDMIGKVICEWFDKGKQMSGTFDPAALQKFEAPPPPSYSGRASRG